MLCGTERAGRARANPRWFSACEAASLVAWFCILPPGGIALNAAPANAVDPFIAAIETLKHSVGSMDCLAVNGAEAKLLKRIGSAFLISESGDFLTAAHVVMDMQKGNDSCPTPAITLPTGDWHPEAPTENMLWFPFKTEDCSVDNAVDVAQCRPSGDLPARIRKLHLKAVQFEWNIPPNGTQVAFAGFPLEARDPMTFRAHVAAYRGEWLDERKPELVLDHSSLPGFSGSPVFLADGKVVAVLVRDGKPEADGTAIARPVEVLRKVLGERLQRQ